MGSSGHNLKDVQAAGVFLLNASDEVLSNVKWNICDLLNPKSIADSLQITAQQMFTS